MSLPDLYSCSIGVIGLGYVGLPLAVELSKKKLCNLTKKNLKRRIVGFDISESRISELKKGIDRTRENEKKDLLNNNNLHFSNKTEDLRDLDVYLVTVPTPITIEKLPDLSIVINATNKIGELIKRRNSILEPIIIYESTVYPGATEEICIPILEKITGKKLNKNFYCAFSPERINPGDPSHKLLDIIKVTSGSDEASAEWVDKFYGSFVNAGTFKAKSIKVAEAAKIIENTQRDLNIALMNELAIIFNLMSIDTLDVLEAAGSKWNFINFKPGLVGGHCIGVDPYYLKWKAEQLGHNPEIITTGRKVNENMHFFVAKLIQEIFNDCKNKKTLILGYTFKENCPDTRNTKIYDLFMYLNSLQMQVSIFDPVADFDSSPHIIKKSSINKISSDMKFDVIILAVKHDLFKEILSLDMNKFLRKNGKIIDIKGFFPRNKNVIRI